MFTMNLIEKTQGIQAAPGSPGTTPAARKHEEPASSGTGESVHTVTCHVKSNRQLLHGSAGEKSQGRTLVVSEAGPHLCPSRLCIGGLVPAGLVHRSCNSGFSLASANGAWQEMGTYGEGGARLLLLLFLFGPHLLDY